MGRGKSFDSTFQAPPRPSCDETHARRWTGFSPLLSCRRGPTASLYKWRILRSDILFSSGSVLVLCNCYFFVGHKNTTCISVLNLSLSVCHAMMFLLVSCCFLLRNKKKFISVLKSCLYLPHDNFSLCCLFFSFFFSSYRSGQKTLCLTF